MTTIIMHIQFTDGEKAKYEMYLKASLINFVVNGLSSKSNIQLITYEVK